MKIAITMLGTSSMVPTRTRGAPAVLIDYAGEYILVDCGEGTQRQMNMAGKSRARIRKILLTHWHGDHVGGLGPLLQTMSNSAGAGRVELYGPPGTLERFRCVACAMDLNTEGVDVTEVAPEPGQVVTFREEPEYVLQCAAMKHGLPTVGYALVERDRRHIDVERAAALGLAPGPVMGRLQRGETVEVAGKTVTPEEVIEIRPGKKIALVTDTVATPDIVRLAAGANLLICEATYTSDHAALADAYNHMTATTAAALARDAGVARLIVTHFSQRYEYLDALLAEACTVFADTTAAEDFMSVEV